MRRLWAAVALGLVFFVVATILGEMTPGYSARQQAISALSLGPYGWIQDLNFVLLGAALLLAAPAWRTVLGSGRGASAYPRLTMVVGICFILVALFHQDPAPGYNPANLPLNRPTTQGILHLALAGVAALAQVVGFLIMARRFAETPGWRRFAMATAVIALLMVAGITIYGIWSVRPSGWAGVCERLALLLPMMWAVLFLRRLNSAFEASG